MDANNILSADPLDILFDGRNKAYGAYDLRKTYRERLWRSLLIMFSFLLFVLGLNFLLGFIKPDKPAISIGPDIILKNVEPPTPAQKKIIVPPVAQPAGHKVETKTKMFTTPPLIEKNPPENEKPPEMADIDKVTIGTVNNDNGKDASYIVEPPEGKGKGLIDAPQKTDKEDPPFIPIEIESEYPGGLSAWKRYLEHSLFNNYPENARDEAIQGSVVIMFVVDVDGTVSDVTALSGPEELQPGAIAVVRKSGKWIPAIQNGRKVKSYKKQVITFRLEE